MSYTLSAEYIAEARARAYRYQGQWCGTAGGLAADVARLLIERKTMQDSIQTLSDHNEAMMSASGDGCCGGGKCHPPAEPMDATADDIRWSGDSLLRGDDASVAESVLLDALDVIRDRRQKYGAAPEHFARTIGMINVAFADVLVRPLTPSDWAIFIVLDKIGRYTGTGLKTKDFAIDLAGYAACLRECETPEVIE